MAVMRAVTLLNVLVARVSVRPTHDLGCLVVAGSRVWWSGGSAQWSRSTPAGAAPSWRDRPGEAPRLLKHRDAMVGVVLARVRERVHPRAEHRAGRSSRMPTDP